MPFYAGLKIRTNDDAATKARKQRVAGKLLGLRAAMAHHFAAPAAPGPVDRLQTVRIGTWNIREFGNSKSGGRDDGESLYYIAEIISNFDIVALQEIRADLDEFGKLMRLLGPEWDYLATDVTDGGPGNGERMVFTYNKSRAWFRNIAGELTLAEESKIRAAFGERIKLDPTVEVILPPGVDLSGTYAARLRSKSGGKVLDRDVEIDLPPGCTLKLPNGCAVVVTKNTPVDSPGTGKADIDLPTPIVGEDRLRLRLPNDSFDDSLRQFARTPYLISFQAGWLKINLCTVHIYYGEDDDPAKMEQRRREIELLTAALAKKADGELKHDRGAFLGVLGDFNIIGAGHPTMDALESSGFVIPDELKSIPGSNVARDKHYDQIAFWKPTNDRGYAKLDIIGAGVFDYYEHVFTDADEPIYTPQITGNTSYGTWRTYKMSDHLPMWIELRNNFSQEYLEAIP